MQMLVMAIPEKPKKSRVNLLKIKIMLNRNFFFQRVRQFLFDGKMTQKQIDGLNAILQYWESNHTKKDDRWLAYILATTHHETGRTFQPLEEWGKGKGRKYGSMIKMSGKSYTLPVKLFYGRGFVQLTWYENYETIGKRLKIDLLNQPELALDLDVATKILVEGMIGGWFTGKKLADYFNTNTESWLGARYIINGKDKNQLIMSYALQYYAAISYTV